MAHQSISLFENKHRCGEKKKISIQLTYKLSISNSPFPCSTLLALLCRDGKIYHDMDGNPTMDGIPTTSQANWMEIQPPGWKSNQPKKSEKLKVLDFAHAPHTVALETSRLSNAIVLLNLGRLKQSASSLNDRKKSFYNSLDGFPTIKISQKTQKANFRPNSLKNLA